MQTLKNDFFFSCKDWKNPTEVIYRSGWLYAGSSVTHLQCSQLIVFLQELKKGKKKPQKSLQLNYYSASKNVFCFIFETICKRSTWFSFLRGLEKIKTIERKVYSCHPLVTKSKSRFYHSEINYAHIVLKTSRKCTLIWHKSHLCSLKTERAIGILTWYVQRQLFWDLLPPRTSQQPSVTPVTFPKFNWRFTCRFLPKFNKRCTLVTLPKLS